MRKSNRKCSVDGCDRKHSARDYCNMHLQRWLKHGNPISGRPSITTKDGEPLQWILDHLDYGGDDCLKWPFGEDGHGYGQLQYEGRVVKAHRLMCTKVNGEPPFINAEAAHSCGNGKKGCVNQRHLRWATSKENNWDRVGHETDNRGERCGTHKLVREDVLAIVTLLQTGSKTHQSIADAYGVHRNTVTDISKGKNWGWLTGIDYAFRPRPPEPPAELRQAA